MTPTEHLFGIAEAEGIAIEICSMPPPLLGLYVASVEHPPVIAIHSAVERNECLLRCVLAEELGHHFTSIGDYTVKPYRSYIGRILLSKAEKQALRWAANVLLPQEELFAVSWASLFDVAETFLVTPTFVRAIFSLPAYAKRLCRLAGERVASNIG